MFSQTAEYVLRVVVFLASQDKHPVTTRQIAAATRVPEGYLAKVLQNLGRAGLVDSQRGLHGGFVLARDPTKLTVFDVLAATEPVRRICSCPLGIESHSKQLCPLHQRLDDALALVENALRKSTITDLLNEPTESPPLCAAGESLPMDRPSREARKRPKPARKS